MEYINVPNDGGHGLKFGSKKYSIHNLNCSSPSAYKAGPLQHKHVLLFFQLYKLNMKYKKYRNVFFFFFFRFSFLRGHRILNIHIILNYISENESKLVRDPTLVLYNEKRFFFFFHLGSRVHLETYKCFIMISSHEHKAQKNKMYYPFSLII